MHDKTALEKSRDAIFSGEDCEVYLHVGYFFTWYGQHESKITTLMAIIMGDTDLSAFEVLVRTLDGQTKVRRLTELCKIKNRDIEQSLLVPLKHYEKKICPIRNRLAHTALL